MNKKEFHKTKARPYFIFRLWYYALGLRIKAAFPSDTGWGPRRSQLALLWANMLMSVSGRFWEFK